MLKVTERAIDRTRIPALVRGEALWIPERPEYMGKGSVFP